VTPEIGPIRAHQQIVCNEARLREINKKFCKAGYDVDNFPHNYPVYFPHK
jgi:F420-0:gamma-glutamyl ligase-like protein